MYDEMSQAVFGEAGLLRDIEEYGQATRPESIRFAKQNPTAIETFKRIILLAAQVIPKELSPVLRESLEKEQLEARSRLALTRGRASNQTIPLRILFEDQTGGDPYGPGLLIRRLRVWASIPLAMMFSIRNFSMTIPLIIIGQSSLTSQVSTSVGEMEFLLTLCNDARASLGEKSSLRSAKFYSADSTSGSSPPASDSSDWTCKRKI